MELVEFSLHVITIPVNPLYKRNMQPDTQMVFSDYAAGLSTLSATTREVKKRDKHINVCMYRKPQNFCRV